MQALQERAPERLDAIIDRARKGGGEIVGLLKTGSDIFGGNRTIEFLFTAGLCGNKYFFAFEFFGKLLQIKESNIRRTILLDDGKEGNKNRDSVV